MENRQLLIICAVILIAACIIGAGLYFGLTNQNAANTNLTNNATNSTNNTNITVEKIANNTDNPNTDKSAGSGGDDYVYSPQKGEYVKKSGQYDKDSQGNTVYSYQGSDGVIYGKYYDSSGRELSSDEYYR